MKMVFLDGNDFQKAEENFNYDAFSALGEFSFFSYTPEELIAERAHDADVVIVLKSYLNKDTLSKLKKTKLICKIGTGLDRIDIQAANSFDITVTNFPGHAAGMVAQWTISLLLGLAGNLFLYDKAVKNNNWLTSQFSYPITEISGKTLGIIGYGKIGKKVAALASVLGMKVLVSSRYPEKNTPDISFGDNHYIFKHSDFISLHCLLSEHNRNLVNVEIFNLMKPSAYLINTARAALIDKDALFMALKNKKIAGAALDGFWKEPPEKNDPLIALDNLVITPHVAWGSTETRQVLLDVMAKRIQELFR